MCTMAGKQYTVVFIWLWPRKKQFEVIKKFEVKTFPFIIFVIITVLLPLVHTQSVSQSAIHHSSSSFLFSRMFHFIYSMQTQIVCVRTCVWIYKFHHFSTVFIIVVVVVFVFIYLLKMYNRTARVPNEWILKCEINQNRWQNCHVICHTLSHSLTHTCSNNKALNFEFVVKFQSQRNKCMKNG